MKQIKQERRRCPLSCFYQVILRLSHDDFHGVLAFCGGNHVTLNGFTVEGDALDALLHAIGILHGDDIFRSTELALHRVFFGRLRHAGIDKQSVVVGLDAEDVLRGGEPHPGGGTREP